MAAGWQLQVLLKPETEPEEQFDSQTTFGFSNDNSMKHYSIVIIVLPSKKTSFCLTNQISKPSNVLQESKMYQKA